MPSDNGDNIGTPKTPKTPGQVLSSYGSSYNPDSSAPTPNTATTITTSVSEISVRAIRSQETLINTPSPLTASESQSEPQPPSPQQQQLQHQPQQIKRYSGMSTMEEYEIINDLGKGTFGVVSKAKQKSSNKFVALKQLIIHDSKDGFPITAFREITIMKKFKHGNVLQLIDMIHETSKDPSKAGCFYTVTPYMSSDLNGLLHNPRVILTISQKKCILVQLLEGINYIHGMNFLHRDIKTANILLDYFGVVKIADFGLARVYHGPPPKTSNSLPGGGKYDYTGLVVTRWYRPPELLLGERKYTTAVDMWGIGCVMGELYKRSPILEGKSDLDQADIIFRLVGAPTEQSMPGFKSLKGNGVNTNVDYRRTLETTFSEVGPKGLPLLAGLLRLDPKARFNAAKALEHEFFTSPPLPCKPTDLPKFEESHEADVQTYKEELSKREASFSPPQSVAKYPGMPPGTSSWSKNNVLNGGGAAQRSSWTKGDQQQSQQYQTNRPSKTLLNSLNNQSGRMNHVDSYNRDWNKPRPSIPLKPRHLPISGVGKPYPTNGSSSSGNTNMYAKSANSSSLAKLKSVVHGSQNSNEANKRKTDEVTEDNKRPKRN